MEDQQPRFGHWQSRIERIGERRRAAREVERLARKDTVLSRCSTLLPAELEIIEPATPSPMYTPELIERTPLSRTPDVVQLTSSIALWPIGSRFVGLDLPHEPLCAAVLPSASPSDEPVDQFVLIGSRDGLSLLDNAPEDAPIAAPSLEHSVVRHIWSGVGVHSIEIDEGILVAVCEREVRVWSLPPIRRLVKWRSTNPEAPPISLSPPEPQSSPKAAKRLSQIRSLFQQVSIASETASVEADWARSYATIKLPEPASPVVSATLLRSASLFIAIATKSSIYLYAVKEDDDQWTWALKHEVFVPDAPTSIAFVDVKGEAEPRLFIALHDKACAVRLMDKIVDEMVFPSSSLQIRTPTTRPRSTSRLSAFSRHSIDLKGRAIPCPSWSYLPELSLLTFGCTSLAVSSPLGNSPRRPELELDVVQSLSWRELTTRVVPIFPAEDRVGLVGFSDSGIEATELTTAFTSVPRDDDIVPVYTFSRCRYLCPSSSDSHFLYGDGRLYMLG